MDAGRATRLADADFEARLSRLRIEAVTVDGVRGVRLQVRPSEPEDRFDHGVVTFLTCDDHGCPLMVTDNRLDHHPMGEDATEPGRGVRHHLVDWLTGRWAWEALTDDLDKVEVGDTARAVERIAADIAMALGDAGYPAPFAEALRAVSGWVNGPYRSLHDLFTDDEEGAELRAFVIENPFLSDLAYPGLTWTPDDSRRYGKRPPSFPDVSPALLAKFRSGPWNDRGEILRLEAELSGDYRTFEERVLLALSGLTPEAVPDTFEGLRAFAAVLVAIARDRNSKFPADVVGLVHGERDWIGLERRFGEFLRSRPGDGRAVAHLDEALLPIAKAFANHVLLPLRARAGTLQSFAGYEAPAELTVTAARLVFGGRTYRDCLGAAALGQDIEKALRGILPREGVPGRRSWDPLFPVTRRDGFLVLCLSTEADVAGGGYPCRRDSGPSHRALAASGWIHVAVVTAFTDGGAPLPVLRANIHWDGGRWQRYDAYGLEYERSTGQQRSIWAEARPTARSLGAEAALKAVLDALPDAPRPPYAPISQAHMAQDACGYDWTDDGMLAKAFEAFRPVLPPHLADLSQVDAALTQADMHRPIPSRRSLPWQGYATPKFLAELEEFGITDETDETE